MAYIKKGGKRSHSTSIILKLFSQPEGCWQLFFWHTVYLFQWDPVRETFAFVYVIENVKHIKSASSGDACSTDLLFSACEIPS